MSAISSSKTLTGFIICMVAGIFWGTFGTFVKLMTNYGFTESAIAILGPAMMVIFYAIKAYCKNPQLFLVNRQQLIVLIIVGVLAVIGSNWCYAVALGKGLPLAVASIITFLNYYLVIIGARIIWKNKITPVKILSGIAVIGGISLILDVFGTLTATAAGLFWMGLTVCGFAAGYLLVRHAMDIGIDTDIYLAYTNLFGIIGLSFINPPWDVVSEVIANTQAFGLPAVLALLGFGLIPQVASFYLLLEGYNYLEPALVVIVYSSFDPITVSILGYLLFGETLTMLQILGIIIVLGAIIWLQLAEQAEERKLAQQNKVSLVE
ncbi:DMT family transporter [Sporomusa sp. KB1]|jgi:drug/metabolite transporter (DMT)-like permease|uniref:DMT family transporter n=1 Tax=Sporomusa sp. KB1 TaxID=943346 RepID=UPI0011A6A158|nr:DMT family transporter [Sporomusa sp. KB1]TWH45120.1 EamA domain-containing membrane protein RarD [Sporomusa sp. KB1]